MQDNQVLRICIDARPLLHKGGITRYTWEMVSALSSLFKGELVLIAHKDFTPPPGKNIIKIVDTAFSFLPGSLWFFWRSPVLAKKHRCQVLWGTHPMLPRRLSSSVLYVVTWHDVVWKILPDTMRFYNRMVNHFLARHSVHVADKIICVSNTTEKDLVSFYPEAAGKTTVCYEGKSLPDRPNTPSPFGFPFLFTLGSIEPRKNILALVHAFEELVSMPTFQDYRLVISGPSGWKNHTLFQHLSQSSKRERIIFTGYLSDEEIIAAMNACALFVFPSLYEGFGLPLLEAEGKCPVVANDIEVFRELEGVFENLLFCDFSQPSKTVAQSLSSLLSKGPSKLTFRSVQPPSWQASAQHLLSIIEDAL